MERLMTPKSAIVIEPNRLLAGTLDDFLRGQGFDVMLCTTHKGAAEAARASGHTDLLAACIPASDDDRDGAYLDEVRGRQSGRLPTVLMLSDPDAADGTEPPDAVRLIKPFSKDQFVKAVQEAMEGTA